MPASEDGRYKNRPSSRMAPMAEFRKRIGVGFIGVVGVGIGIGWAGAGEGREIPIRRTDELRPICLDEDSTKFLAGGVDGFHEDAGDFGEGGSSFGRNAAFGYCGKEMD